MKRLLLLILSSIVLLGCSEKYEENLGLKPALVPRYLSVSPTSFEFTATYTQTKPLSVTSVQTPWTIENSVNWITISNTSGSASAEVPVGVYENTIGDVARTGVFYFRSGASDWEYDAPISVTQEGAYPVINFSRNEIELKGAAVTDTVKVLSNCTWFEDGISHDWLTVSADGDVLTIKATANETNNYRTATVKLSHTGNINISSTFTVKQAPANITAGTDSLKLENEAASITISIESEAPWTASTASSWMEISPSSGDAGKTELNIEIAPNTTIYTRTGYIILSIGGTERVQIPVVQKGYYIEVDATEFNYESGGGTYDLQITSNTEWEITEIPKWITIDKTSGKGSKTVKVTAADNPITQSRSAVIHVGQSGLSLDNEISLFQKGKYFDIGTTVYNFDDKASTKEVKIETDGTWTATTNEDWITLKPTTSKDSILTIGVTENISEDERTGVVSVTMGDKTIEINVLQKGKYFTIDNSLLTYTSKGGDIKISITTSEAWTAKIEDNPKWITLSQTSGTGDIEVTATAEDNPSVNSRTATIIFETTYLQPVRVIVKQDARTLTVDTRELLFYPKGGTSDPITITTDGEYKIECSDSWFSVEQTGNTFTVTATKYTETSFPRIGTVTISLTDLKEGSYSLGITVTQLNEGGSFLRNDYGDDKNHDQNVSTSGTLTIKGFGDDKNWDSSISSSTNLTITSFNSDKNWDSALGTRIAVSVTGINQNK